MSIPPRFLDEIRSRLTLSDVIGKRLKITRAGREFKACCPFHKEKTPSFTINDDKQFYHCFGCGAHGDVIGFVMQNDNLSFPDAVRMLSAEAGLQMPEQSPEEMKRAEKAKDLRTLMEDAADYFMEVLHSPEKGGEVFQYLSERGMSADTIAAFRIGYAPPDGQALRKHLSTKGYTDAQMIEAGLLKKSGKGGDPYVFFRDRVMFPVSDRRGRVVAFGGRILPEHIRAPQSGDFDPPKYINSAETPLFDKGRMLYGESLARQAARNDHSIIVTEGYMDVIACHQGGFHGAVAPMGTALTEEQILLLWAMIPDDEKVPVLCFDGDEAGRRAASRACENFLPLLKPGQSARFAFLPEGEDPDSLLRSGGKAALRSVLESAMPLFDFIWMSHTAGRQFETPESRAGVTRALQNHISEIADAEVQKHYKERLRAKISETFFTSYNNARGKTRPLPKAHIARPRSPVFRSGDVAARILLAAVINHPHIYDQVEESFGHYDIGQKNLDRVRQNIIAAMEQNPDLDSEGLKHHLRQGGFEKEIGDILNESVYVHAAFCRPGADSQIVGVAWADFLKSLPDDVFEREIKTGWKQAFESANEEDEEKLRTMVREKASEGT